MAGDASGLALPVVGLAKDVIDIYAADFIELFATVAVQNDSIDPAAVHVDERIGNFI